MKIKTLNKLFPINTEQNGEKVVFGNVVHLGFEYTFFPKFKGHGIFAMEITFDCNWGISEIVKNDL